MKSATERILRVNAEKSAERKRPHSALQARWSGVECDALRKVPASFAEGLFLLPTSSARNAICGPSGEEGVNGYFRPSALIWGTFRTPCRVDTKSATERVLRVNAENSAERKRPYSALYAGCPAREPAASTRNRPLNAFCVSTRKGPRSAFRVPTRQRQLLIKRRRVGD